MKSGDLEGTINFNPIIEETINDNGNLALAILLGATAITSLIFIIKVFNLDITNALVGTLMVAIAFSVIVFILIRPSIIKNIRQEEFENFTQPIIQPIEKPLPIIKEIIREIEKPIIEIREVPVIREVTKHVFIETPRKKLNIPKYKFRGSTEAMTYHKTSCRFSKLIKGKYKVSRNDTKDFKKHGFKPCKICRPDKN